MSGTVHHNCELGESRKHTLPNFQTSSKSRTLWEEVERISGLPFPIGGQKAFPLPSSVGGTPGDGLNTVDAPLGSSDRLVCLGNDACAKAVDTAQEDLCVATRRI